MKKTGRVLIAVAALAAGTGMAHAGTVKCIDDKGVTHYGATLPPECVGHGTAELSKRGIVLRRTERAPTEDERKARQVEAEQRRVAAQREAERKRHDDMLLASYSNEGEIDAACAREAERAQAMIAAATALRARQTDDAGRGRLDAIVESARKELDQIRARHDSYKARFIELKKASAGVQIGKL
ncbi:MAG TPA: DUF4124 domain-containing protein [Burkholderiales bacterium]|nr:DUF4124 domain-containing protein [Burkholderiales bacterium]